MLKAEQDMQPLRSTAQLFPFPGWVRTRQEAQFNCIQIMESFAFTQSHFKLDSGRRLKVVFPRDVDMYETAIFADSG